MTFTASGGTSSGRGNHRNCPNYGAASAEIRAQIEQSFEQGTALLRRYGTLYCSSVAIIALITESKSVRQAKALL